MNLVGIGLSEEAMQSLFNPFKQTQRLAGGTGLGLYSLAKRIDALNGQYGVKKRKDGKQGSLFWFTIPYRADQTTADNFSNNRNHPLRDSVIFSRPLSYDIGDDTHVTGSSLKNDYQNIQKAFSVSTEDGTLHVLMAEDSHTIAKMTSMMLKRQGYKVTVAENGELAVKLIMDSYHADDGKVKYDVVLMDLQMPVMDGLEATRRLRQIELESHKQYANSPGTVDTGPVSPKNSNGKKLFPHILVIGVSANSDHETMEEAYQAGIDAFISKPFAVETFSNTAAALISRL
jgi:CheY-like chemotaxis protein